MTKKDYVLIAEAIARTRMASDITGSATVKAAKAAALRLLAIHIAATLAHENPRFDRNRFLKATGFSL